MLPDEMQQQQRINKAQAAKISDLKQELAELNDLKQELHAALIKMQAKDDGGASRGLPWRCTQKCGAHSRTRGQPCRGPAMANGRVGCIGGAAGSPDRSQLDETTQAAPAVGRSIYHPQSHILIANSNILEGAESAETVAAYLKAHPSKPLQWAIS